LIKNGFSSSFFDLTRFIAALLVVLGHGMSRFFPPFSWESDPSITELSFRILLTGYGSQAVTVFFILSGYFIGMSVIKQTESNRFSYKPYILKRVIRLWIVLIPGLLLTLVLDSIGTSFFTSDVMYSSGNIVGSIQSSDLTLLNWLANALFMQTILVGPFGTNGALWSISYEFWYYAICPSFIYIIAGKRVLLSSILLILVLIAVGTNIAKLFPLWLMGVAVFALSRKPTIISKLKSMKYLYIVFVLFVAVAVAFRIFSGIDKDTERYTVGLAFSLLMLVVLANDRPLINQKNHIICFSLASFSYSLYVIHTPILGIFRAVSMRDSKFWDFSILNASVFLLVIMCVVFISYLFSRLTEVHTSKLYKKLRL